MSVEYFDQLDSTVFGNTHVSGSRRGWGSAEVTVDRCGHKADNAH